MGGDFGGSGECTISLVMKVFVNVHITAFWLLVITFLASVTSVFLLVSPIMFMFNNFVYCQLMLVCESFVTISTSLSL